MPSKITVVTCGLLLLFGVVTAHAAVGIGVFLKRSPAFLEQQTVDFYISGFNTGTVAEQVDVHVGVIAENGTIYEYPNWNTSLTPWLRAFSIPAGFRLGATYLGNLDSFPGGLTPGAYKLAVALTRPGTLDILALDVTPFVVQGDETVWTSSGISLGKGESPSGVTAPVVSGAGSFSRVTFDPGTLITLFNQSTPDVDQCIFNTTPRVLEVLVGENNITSLDAGDLLRISAPALGSVDLNKVVLSDGSITYGNSTIAESFFRSGTNYTATGFGGPGFAPFSASRTAPSAIVVSQPDLSSLQSINSGQDLVLRWLGRNGVGELLVTISATNGTLAEPMDVTCRFVDDGHGVVPSALLVQLRDAIAAAGTQIPGISGIDGFDIADILGDSVALPNASLVVSRLYTEVVSASADDRVTFAVTRALGVSVNLQ